MQAHGWKSRLSLSLAARACLQTFLDSFGTLNGALIPNISTALSRSAILGNSSEMEGRVLPLEATSSGGIVASEALQIRVCSYSVARAGSVFFQDNLTEEEGRLSSGHCKLLSLLRMLQAIRSGRPFKGEHLLWLTDSMNLCAFLSKGSNKLHIQAEILEIFWFSSGSESRYKL